MINIMSTSKGKQGTTKKIRKSVQLSKEERTALKKFSKQYTTQDEAADALGLDRATYIRIKELGRGSEEKISILRNKLNHAA